MMIRSAPRVSIGLPIYNGERFLVEALDSLLTQTYSDFELVISDNASIDKTEEICREYVNRDTRIRYYRNERNNGVDANFNRVFQLSTGEYFKWASADDLCKPEHLERCLAILDDDGSVVLAASKTRFIDEEGRTLDIHDPGWDLRSDNAYERLYCVIDSGHWMNATFGVMRANALVKTRLIGSYPKGDYRLLAELSLIGKIVQIPECLFLRRIHPGASSQNAANMRLTTEFHKGDANRLCLPFANLSFDYIITIITSELGVRQKLLLIASVLRRLWWGHRRLLEEVKIAGMFYWNRLKRNVVNQSAHRESK
jgi:glycosyltransferase involved in cell wall biosynthesis